MKRSHFVGAALALAGVTSAQAGSMRAASFVDSVGVGTHLTQQSAYSDAKKVQTALAYLGVRHLRDAAPDPRSPYPAVFGAYAAAGYDFTLTGAGYSTGIQADLQAAAFQAAHPGAIVGFEGFNEPNNWARPSGGWYAAQANTHLAAAAYTRELLVERAAYPALAGVAILNASDEPPPACSGDTVNVHSYGKFSKSQTVPQYGAPWRTLAYDFNRYVKACPGQPVWFTETGYFTSPGVDGVSEAVQAAYLVQILLYNAQLGVVRTYLYEALDEQTGSSDSEKNYGLAHTDGTPKPAATWVHNLLRWAADTGKTAGTFTPSVFPVTFSDPRIKSLVLAKSDGSHLLFMWADQSLWDGKAGKPVAIAPIHFTYTIPVKRHLTSLHLADGTTWDVGTNAGGAWDYTAGTISIVSIPAS